MILRCSQDWEPLIWGVSGVSVGCWENGKWAEDSSITFSSWETIFLLCWGDCGDKYHNCHPLVWVWEGFLTEMKLFWKRTPYNFIIRIEEPRLGQGLGRVRVNYAQSWNRAFNREQLKNTKYPWTRLCFL